MHLSRLLELIAPPSYDGFSELPFTRVTDSD
jgi:hypothetical protein